MTGTELLAILRLRPGELFNVLPINIEFISQMLTDFCNVTSRKTTSMNELGGVTLG